MRRNARQRGCSRRIAGCSRWARAAPPKQFKTSPDWGLRLPQRIYVDPCAIVSQERQKVNELIKSSSRPPLILAGLDVAANAISALTARAGRGDGRDPNSYFVSLYETACGRSPTEVAPGPLRPGGPRTRPRRSIPEQRSREWRFRWGRRRSGTIKGTKEALRQAGEPNAFPPVLFCSPTMELGVDISALNAALSA